MEAIQPSSVMVWKTTVPSASSEANTARAHAKRLRLTRSMGVVSRSVDEEAQERQLNLHLEPQHLGGVYANFANVSFSDYEFTLTFARIDHEVEEGEIPGVVVARVNMTARFTRSCSTRCRTPGRSGRRARRSGTCPSHSQALKHSRRVDADLRRGSERGDRCTARAAARRRGTRRAARGRACKRANPARGDGGICSRRPGRPEPHESSPRASRGIILAET